MNPQQKWRGLKTGEKPLYAFIVWWLYLQHAPSALVVDTCTIHTPLVEKSAFCCHMRAFALLCLAMLMPQCRPMNECVSDSWITWVTWLSCWSMRAQVDSESAFFEWRSFAPLLGMLSVPMIMWVVMCPLHWGWHACALFGGFVCYCASVGGLCMSVVNH